MSFKKERKMNKNNNKLTAKDFAFIAKMEDVIEREIGDKEFDHFLDLIVENNISDDKYSTLLYYIYTSILAKQDSKLAYNIIKANMLQGTI